ncbi:MAG: hypothetical protein HQM16_17290, partial [Deltaproteobacteria bacterium]|nr:hypothetical protein [Deltaproteobacteria bacterium]
MIARQKKITAFLIIICLALLYVLLPVIADKQERLKTVTSFNKNAGGLSVLYHLLKGANDENKQLLMKPLISIDEINSAKSYALFSPLFPFTERQARLVREYVDAGGILLTSFHDEITFGAVNILLKEFETELKIKEDKDFKNRTPVVVTAEADDLLLRRGEAYLMYAAFVFDTEDCKDHNIHCTYKTFEHGNGNVFVFAGIPPFANILIDKQNN